MAKTRKRTDYRALKKQLNKYHSFSFSMPRKGKDFTPAQKAAITRQYKKLRGVIENEEKTTFVKYQKGKAYSNVEGLRTNKGIIIESPDAKIKQDKKTRKYFIERKTGQYKLDDYTFPPNVLLNPELIDPWVKKLIKKYGKRFDGIMWLRHLTYVTSRYEPSLVNMYLSAENMKEERAKKGSLVGVTIVHRKVIKEWYEIKE